VLGLITVVTLPACNRKLEAQACETLLLHYTELLARSDRPDANTLERLRFKEQAREKAAKDPEVAKCSQAVSRGQFDCAMAATSTDDFERCLM
jgi:hypothetical protein